MTEEELKLQIVELQEQVEALKNLEENYQSQIQDFETQKGTWMEERGKLQQLNQQLFLKVSQPVQPEPHVAQHKQPEVETSWDDIAAKI